MRVRATMKNESNLGIYSYRYYMSNHMVLTEIRDDRCTSFRVYNENFEERKYWNEFIISIDLHERIQWQHLLTHYEDELLRTLGRMITDEDLPYNTHINLANRNDLLVIGPGKLFYMAYGERGDISIN